MRAVHRFLRRLAGDRRGNLMIEFTLALPILFLLLVGLLDLGRFSLQKSALLQGAREGAQYGILASGDSANINNTARSATGLTGASAANNVFCECSNNLGTAVSCSGASTCTGGATRKTYITVTTTVSFDSVVGAATTFGSFGRWSPPTSLSASVTMTVP